MRLSPVCSSAKCPARRFFFASCNSLEPPSLRRHSSSNQTRPQHLNIAHICLARTTSSCKVCILPHLYEHIQTERGARLPGRRSDKQNNPLLVVKRHRGIQGVCTNVLCGCHTIIRTHKFKLCLREWIKNVSNN